MSDAVFNGKIVSGHFIPDDAVRYKRTYLAREGKRTRVVIGGERRRHTNTQRDYYWAGIVRPFAQWSSGENHPSAELEQDVHDMLLREVLVPMLPERFLRPTPTGEPIRGKGSTKALEVDEMNEYIAKARIWLVHEYGFETPDIDHVSLKR